MSELMGIVHPRVVEILNFDSFGPLKSGEGRMHVNHACTIRKAGRTLIWGSHRSQREGQTLIISNQ